MEYKIEILIPFFIILFKFNACENFHRVCVSSKFLPNSVKIVFTPFIKCKFEKTLLHDSILF